MQSRIKQSRRRNIFFSRSAHHLTVVGPCIEKVFWIIYGNRCFRFLCFSTFFGFNFADFYELNPQRGERKGKRRYFSLQFIHLIVWFIFNWGHYREWGNIAAHWFCAKLHRFILRSMSQQPPYLAPYLSLLWLHIQFAIAKTLILIFNYAYSTYISLGKVFQRVLGTVWATICMHFSVWLLMMAAAATTTTKWKWN